MLFSLSNTKFHNHMMFPIQLTETQLASLSNIILTQDTTQADFFYHRLNRQQIDGTPDKRAGVIGSPLLMKEIDYWLETYTKYAHVSIKDSLTNGKEFITNYLRQCNRIPYRNGGFFGKANLEPQGEWAIVYLVDFRNTNPSPEDLSSIYGLTITNQNEDITHVTYEHPYFGKISFTLPTEDAKRLNFLRVRETMIYFNRNTKETYFVFGVPLAMSLKRLRSGTAVDCEIRYSEETGTVLNFSFPNSKAIQPFSISLSAYKDIGSFIKAEVYETYTKCDIPIKHSLFDTNLHLRVMSIRDHRYINHLFKLSEEILSHIPHKSFLKKMTISYPGISTGHPDAILISDVVNILSYEVNRLGYYITLSEYSL